MVLAKKDRICLKWFKSVETKGRKRKKLSDTSPWPPPYTVQWLFLLNWNGFDCIKPHKIMLMYKNTNTDAKKIKQVITFSNCWASCWPRPHLGPHKLYCPSSWWLCGEREGLKNFLFTVENSQTGLNVWVNLFYRWVTVRQSKFHFRVTVKLVSF